MSVTTSLVTVKCRASSKISSGMKPHVVTMVKYSAQHLRSNNPMPSVAKRPA